MSSGPDSERRPPVSVLVVDDHPALRAGLERLIAEEPGFLFAGAVSDEDALVAALLRVRPDVIVLDQELGRGSGLAVCLRIKQLPRPPAVLLYTGRADHVFAVPAKIAQADAVISKHAPVDTLLETLRAVADGEVRLPSPDPEAMAAASSRLLDDDLPIVGMLVARASVEDIAVTLDLRPAQVWARALRIIGELQARGRDAWVPMPMAATRGAA